MSKELEQQIVFLENKVEALRSQIAYYEQDGVGKLYHALNRKASEMAELLNKTSLLVIDIDDPKVKTFDRLQKIWSDAESISTAIKALGILAGISNDTEAKEVKKEMVIQRPFSPESVADAVGELAGKSTNNYV
jgi:hypothetical protein